MIFWIIQINYRYLSIIVYFNNHNKLQIRKYIEGKYFFGGSNGFRVAPL